MRNIQPNDLEIAAMAALHHWHANGRNFHRREPAYLALLRSALERRELLPYQIDTRSMDFDAIVERATA